MRTVTYYDAPFMEKNLDGRLSIVVTDNQRLCLPSSLSSVKPVLDDCANDEL